MSETKKLAFVLMLDTSGSMWNAIDMVKIDAKAFVRQARSGDQFAINQFSDNASWVYPNEKNPKLLTVSKDLHETKASLDYIERLTARNLTAMGEAIKLGNNIMSNSKLTADLKAYVILSDGAHNEGIDPVAELKNEPPVYIAALGNVYKGYFDQLIAKNSKSRFYNKPNAYQMMLMFNQIVADSNNNELIINDLDSYQKSADYIIKKFQVSSEDNSMQLNVVWSNKKYGYTPGDPKGEKINIVLIDPDDNNTDIRPDISENGYCIYNLENVKPGTWKMLIQYSIADSFTGTIGGVDFYTDIKTNLLLPRNAGTDNDFKLRVSAMNGTDTLDKAKVTVQIARPIISESSIKEQYAEKLDLLIKDGTDGEMNDNSVMEKLRLDVLKTENKDIFAKETTQHELSLSDDGTYALDLKGKCASGICNIDVKIEGIDSKTKLPFTRLKSGAVYVE